MILDPLSPGLSLNAAHGLVETLREALFGASCPRWTGVAGDSYRLRQAEVAACAQGTVDRIQEALNLVSAFDLAREQGLSHSLTTISEGNRSALDPASSRQW